MAGASAAYAVASPGSAGSAHGAEATSGLTFSGLTAYAAAEGGGSLALKVQPLTVIGTSPAQPMTSSSLASAVDAVRLAAARLQDGQPPSIEGTAAPLPPAAPTVTPTPAEPSCEKTAGGLYCIYTVQSGDTLSKIAKQFGLTGTQGVASWELVVQSNKPDITSADDFIQPGQKLRIPLKNGIVHLVLTGETAGELAQDYGVTTAALIAAGNNVPESGALTIGQEILIPDPAHLPPAKPAPAAPPPVPTATATSTPEDEDETPTATAQPSGTPAATPTKTPTPSGAPKVSKAGFIWPATGPISSYFGPSHPLGIDIDLFANPNAPILAAAAGKVVFAGGDACCSYGLYVIIDHGNGYTTLYAHLSKINVAAGQQVTQGQVIGLGGRTGYATGNHLHFEVRINDAVIDPLSVLP